jgi:hypothetical protein
VLQHREPGGVPHGARPGGQLQVPLMHCLPPVQVSPQAEQLAIVPIFVGVQLQQRNPAGT